MNRATSSRGEEPATALLAFRHAFGEQPDFVAFAKDVQEDSAILGYVLSRWEAQRRSNPMAKPELLPPYGWKVMALIPPADAALTRLGATWPWLDGFIGTATWADLLRDNIDSAVGVLAKMRQGLTVAAVVGTRHFLERWTFNVASSHSLDWKAAEESDAEFITRIWQHYGVDLLGRDPGADWAWLSELQHGRDVKLGSRSVNLTSDGLAQVAIHAELARILEVPLRQVRGSVLHLLQEEQISEFDLTLSIPAPAMIAGVKEEPPQLSELLAPPEFLTVHRASATWAIQVAEAYRRHTEHEDAFVSFMQLASRDVHEALIERFARTFQNALTAFREEQKMVGDRFSYGELAARLFRYYSIAALASLLGGDVAAAGGRHLQLAANALTSAWNLWLEDADLSLPAVRMLAEQTAVARAYRLKPEKASRLALRPRLPASRWFELAGWGRLSAYVNALGEFSHFGLASRREGARIALTDLQGDVDPAEAPHGARREALDEAAYMLAYEVAARLDQMAPALASAFRDQVTLLNSGEHEARLQSWLERAAKHRGQGFGDPDAANADSVSDHVATGVAAIIGTRHQSPPVQAE